MHLRPFTLRAGCSLPYFREWDLQILSPGSSPPSIFFHSWLSTLFCLLLIVTVLCRLLPALLPRHFCSSLALLPIISAPRASPFFTADAHQCGFSFHHPCHVSQTRSTLSPSETKARKGHLGEAFYISYRQRAAGDSTGGFFFPAELQRKLNSHLLGGGAVKAVKFGPIRHSNEELCLHQS